MLPEEAIGLVYALTAKAAEAAGVRVLAIKGVASTVHGLRAERTPADVDVLIEPRGYTAFTRQLRQWGWRPRIDEFKGFRVPHHSVTYLHEQWPCDIDAHERFPGLLAQPEHTFEALWARRQQIRVAGRLVPTTDWASTVVILALHAVRSIRDDPRHTQELRHLLDLAQRWSTNQRNDLAELARATGCVQSLDAAWPRLGVPTALHSEHVPAEELAEWRRKLDGRLPSGAFWLRYLCGGGPRQALIRARVLLWPPESRIRASRQLSNDRLALFRARLAHLGRALRKVMRSPDSAFQNAIAPTGAIGKSAHPGPRSYPDSQPPRSNKGLLYFRTALERVVTSTFRSERIGGQVTNARPTVTTTTVDRTTSCRNGDSGESKGDAHANRQTE